MKSERKQDGALHPVKSLTHAQTELYIPPALGNIMNVRAVPKKAIMFNLNRKQKRFSTSSESYRDMSLMLRWRRTNVRSNFWITTAQSLATEQ